MSSSSEKRTEKRTLVQNKLAARAFRRALRAFQRRERSLLELLQEVDRVLAGRQAASTGLLAQLINEDRKNPLPTEAFEALERRLRPARRSEQTGELEDGDQTLIEYDEDDETAVTQAGSILHTEPAAPERATSTDTFSSGAGAKATRPRYLTGLSSGVAAVIAIGLALVFVADYVALQRGAGAEAARDSAATNDRAEPAAQDERSAPEVSPEVWQETQLQLKQIKEEHEALTATLENQRTDTRALRRQLQQVGAQLAESTAELETARQALPATRSEEPGSAGEIGALESSVAELRALLEDQRTEAQALQQGDEQQRAELLTILENLQRKEQQIQQALQNHERELQAAREEMRQAKTELAREADAESGNVEELARLESRVAKLQSAFEAQQQTADAVESDSQEARMALQNRFNDLQQKEQELQQTLRMHDQQLSSLRSEQAGLTQRTDAQLAAASDAQTLAVDAAVQHAESPAPPPVQYRLTVQVEPADALVRIMNIRPAYHDGIELTPDGEYDISVTADGYQEHRSPVSLTEPDQVYAVTLVKDPPFPEPQMAFIKAGCFQMGSPAAERGRFDNERLHEVCVEDFWMGQYEVTVGEFRQFADATGYQTEAERGGGCRHWDGAWQSDPNRNWRTPGFEQNESHPTVCVTWIDAVQYTQWIAEQTRAPYRLPTEAEWEYAARGGTTTARYWGDDPNAGCEYANLADKTAQRSWDPLWQIHSCDDGQPYTAGMGLFTPNNYGLYDMLGNAWEWTCSAYDEGYGGGETRCAATNEQSARALRGGSLVNTAALVRSAYRNGDASGQRYFNVGFRLARSESARTKQPQGAPAAATGVSRRSVPRAR
ncbi:MAG: SUMF1/EgtB/PvdO family nonheme iron enzyme [Gammaproteobacteria bacterium]